MLDIGMEMIRSIVASFDNLSICLERLWVTKSPVWVAGTGQDVNQELPKYMSSALLTNLTSLFFQTDGIPFQISVFTCIIFKPMFYCTNSLVFLLSQSIYEHLFSQQIRTTWASFVKIIKYYSGIVIF
jgi:hypothetical protein